MESMPAQWKSMKKDDLKELLIKPMKSTLDGLTQILSIMTEATMDDFLTLWAEEHTTSLNAIAGIVLSTLQEMPDQAYHYQRGTPCRIVRTQQKNSPTKKKAPKKKAPAKSSK